MRRLCQPDTLRSQETVKLFADDFLRKLMSNLNEAQKALSLKAVQEYLSAVNPMSRKAIVDDDAVLDKKRRDLIENRLAPVINAFLAQSMPLADFKTEIDSLNKQNELWGFKGVKGQMFFNLLFNASLDIAELTAEMSAAIASPNTDEMAKSRIRNFASYVRA